MRHRHARPPWVQLLRSPVALIGAATVLAVGGGVAFAGWSVEATSPSFTVYAASIPQMAAPRVRIGAHPRLRWRPVELAPGVPAQRYVVTRYLGPITQVACDVPAGAIPHCVDEFAPAGYQATYTVTAGYGTQWTGPVGKPSAVVTVPGTAVPILVDGVLITPGQDGKPVVPAPASAPPVVASGSASAVPGDPPPSAAQSAWSSPSAAPIPVIVDPPREVPPEPPSGSRAPASSAPPSVAPSAVAPSADS